MLLLLVVCVASVGFVRICAGEICYRTNHMPPMAVVPGQPSPAKICDYVVSTRQIKVSAFHLQALADSRHTYILQVAE